MEEQWNVIYVDRPDDFEVFSAEKFVIATGTKPAKPASVPFNDTTIFCSDGLLKMHHLPRTMIVVGGGVIGVEYACMMAALGVKVTLIEGRRGDWPGRRDALLLFGGVDQGCAAGPGRCRNDHGRGQSPAGVGPEAT